MLQDCASCTAADHVVVLCRQQAVCHWKVLQQRLPSLLLLVLLFVVVEVHALLCCLLSCCCCCCCRCAQHCCGGCLLFALQVMLLL